MKRSHPLVLAVLWAMVIFVLSCLNDTHFGVFGHTVVRKFGHLIEYFVLAYLIYRASKRTFGLGETASSCAAGFLPLVYALADEYHQTFVPTRIGAFSDIVIDMAGVACFFIFLEIRERAATLRINSSL